MHLVARLIAGGFRLLDAQFMTEHLAQFGAVEISRAEYRRAPGSGARRQAATSAGWRAYAGGERGPAGDQPGVVDRVLQRVQARRRGEHPALEHLPRRRRAAGPDGRGWESIDHDRRWRRRSARPAPVRLAGVHGEDQALVADRLAHRRLEAHGLGGDLVQRLDARRAGCAAARRLRRLGVGGGRRSGGGRDCSAVGGLRGAVGGGRRRRRVGARRRRRLAAGAGPAALDGGDVAGAAAGLRRAGCACTSRPADGRARRPATGRPSGARRRRARLVRASRPRSRRWPAGRSPPRAMRALRPPGLDRAGQVRLVVLLPGRRSSGSVVGGSSKV